MTQPHSLTWGLQLAGDTDPGTDYRIEALADGTNLGNPAALFESIRSLLTDGSLVVSDGWDNREVPIRIRLSAPAGIAGPTLAAAEAALMALCVAESKPPLVYVPPADDAATCVYDVVGADLVRDLDRWDEEEVMREYRYYLLTLTCLPFVRGEETTVAAAIPIPPPSPTTIPVDDCTSVAAGGWSYTQTGFAAPTLASTGGAIVLSASPAPGHTGASSFVLKRSTGVISMAGTPYLRVTVKVVGPWGLPPLFEINDAPVTPLASSFGTTVAGYRDYYFATGNFARLNIAIDGLTPGVSMACSIDVADVSRTDTLPASGTKRQQSRMVEVAGSAPTTAAIRVFDATPAALGSDVLVYTSRNTAFAPALRPYRVSSAAVTADTARVSGGRNTLTTPMTFRVPASILSEGNHALMGMLSVTTSGTLSWSARMVSSAGATTLGSDVVVSGSTTVPVTSGYQVLNLGRIPLPIVAVEADQMVELTITGTANMTVDEMWLFNMDDGALTWVRNSTVQWLDIRSPELGAARPSVYGGTGAFGANSVCLDWACSSFGVHRFSPGLMQIFTVTSSSLVSQSEIEYYERDHSHRTGEAA